jgi:hypothetical protein
MAGASSTIPKKRPSEKKPEPTGIGANAKLVLLHTRQSND